MNNDSPHIEFDQMTDLATGYLPLLEAGSAREHIDRCNACGLQYSRLEKLIGVMREDASEDAPARAITSVFRVYDDFLNARSPREKQRPSIVERIKAALRLDSAGLSPLYGMRSVGTSAEQQMLYTAGEIDFDIRIAPTDGGYWSLSGQVFDTISGGEIDLVDSEGKKTTTILDENLYFSFPSTSAGVYKLILRSATIEVEIPDIRLGF